MEETMHALLGALASILLVASLASAGDEKKTHSTQAERMTECNAEAHDKKLTGDARRQFMSDCLKGRANAHEEPAKTDEVAQGKKSTEGRPTGQGEKMKVCNQEATTKNLHGEDRRQFMSQCLKAEKKS
jgi:hypothetical protein